MTSYKKQQQIHDKGMRMRSLNVFDCSLIHPSLFSLSMKNHVCHNWVTENPHNSKKINLQPSNKNIGKSQNASEQKDGSWFQHKFCADELFVRICKQSADVMNLCQEKYWLLGRPTVSFMRISRSHSSLCCNLVCIYMILWLMTHLCK